MDELADRIVQFLPTPSARRATPDRGCQRRRLVISTHALREEGDPLSGIFSPHRGYFYPRPPRGGRPTCTVLDAVLMPFLPTPSARRATGHHLAEIVLRIISTHALREEGDSRSN